MFLGIKQVGVNKNRWRGLGKDHSVIFSGTFHYTKSVTYAKKKKRQEEQE